MIGNLAPFIQFMAAIYVTLTIDNLFCGRFWTKDYYTILQRTISQHKFHDTVKIQNDFNNAVRREFSRLEGNSRKKGFAILAFCILLLIEYAFEPSESDVNDYIVNLRSFTLFCYFFVMAIGYIIMCTHVFKWRWVILYSFFAYVLFKCLCYIMPAMDICTLSSFGIIRFLIVVGLILPFSYQLFLNWLYSTAYVYKINDDLRKEEDCYYNAKQAFTEKEPEKLPNEYKDLAAELAVKQTSGDEQITEINNHLSKRLLALTSPPSLLVLLKTAYRHRENTNIQEQFGPLWNENESIPNDSQKDIGEFVMKTNDGREKQVSHLTDKNEIMNLAQKRKNRK